ncbi:MAG: hypothetical protein AAB305_07040 [Candidatus Zixiibacteriota bacterium]
MAGWKLGAKGEQATQVMRALSILKKTALLFVVAMIGVFAALGVGMKYVSAKQDFQKVAMSQAILATMPNVKIGEPLGEFTFRLADGDSTTTRSLSGGSTILTYVSTTCPHCQSQLRTLNKRLADGVQKTRNVIISDEPLHDIISLLPSNEQVIYAQDSEGKMKFELAIWT